MRVVTYRLAIFAAIPGGALAVMAVAILVLFFLLPVFLIAVAIDDKAFSSDKEQKCLHVGVALGRIFTGVSAAFYSGFKEVAKAVFLVLAGALLGDMHKSISECLK